MPIAAPAPQRILVADDDATARILLRAALHQAGFEVGLAVDGEDALRQFSAHAWDLVMLDVEMPGLDGHEVCATLRAQAGPLLPIVMVTGMDDVNSVERAYDSGATDFIAKPLNLALIGHRVKYLLRASQALLDLKKAEVRNAAILEAIPDLLFELDLDGRYIDYHAPRADLLAAPAEVFIGKTLAEVLPAPAAQVCTQALAAAHEHGSSSGKQFELELAHGKFWFEISVSRKANGAGRPHFIMLSRDISQRKEAERQILRLAHFDSLTGLPNRQSFLDRVNREIVRARHAGRKFGVLFMDLDGFKQINDRLGHAAGDEVLQAVADRLRDTVRPSDVVSRFTETRNEVELARLGGDEFTALILDIEQPAEALTVGHRIRDAMARPFAVQRQRVTLGTSIGIAVYPSDGDAAATLLDRADSAMYRAKTAGGNACELYAPGVELLAPLNAN